MSDSQYIDQTFRRAVYLERLKQSMVNDFGLTLKQIDKLIGQLDIESLTAKQLDKYLDTLDKQLTKTLGVWSDNYREQLSEIFADCYEFEKQSLVKAYEVPATAIATPSNLAALSYAAMAKPLPLTGNTGIPLDDLIKDLNNNEVKRIKQAVRMGHFEGKTNQQLVQQIRGTRANKFKDGILQTTTRNAEAIVRTGVQQVANDARLEIAKQNSDIVTGEQIIATLDSHTCLVAGTLIDTPTGKRPIEQIQKGELVYGGSGRVRKVSGTLKSYKDKLCKVTLSNGQVIVCTQDHRWWNGKEWIEARDLKIGEFLPKTL